MFGSKTLNFAHRGFTASAPENSLAAFKAAMELGVDGIELDTRLCKSGELVVFHDPTLKRMTNGRGFIKNKTLAELRELRLKYADAPSEERIPTLEEVVATAKSNLLLNIEIKANGLPKDHVESEVVNLVRRCGIADQTIISSFNPVIIRRINKLDSALMTGYLVDKNFRFRNSEIPLTKFIGASAIHLEHSLVKDKLIAKMRDLNYYVAVWTVNDPEEMRRLIHLGVHAIITDRPNVLKEMGV
ncbi:glycerophosphodiester phosphodiesterase [bacterium]|nr:glycerophosphodiester phosphodiesterase [bacterium]